MSDPMLPGAGRPTGAERARRRRAESPDKLPRLTAEPDGLLASILDQEGVEDIGTWSVLPIDGKWEALVKRADGSYIDLPKRWATAGEAVDYLIKWATQRGIIPTWPSGALRQYVVPREDAHTVRASDDNPASPADE